MTCISWFHFFFRNGNFFSLMDFPQSLHKSVKLVIFYCHRKVFLFLKRQRLKCFCVFFFMKNVINTKLFLGLRVTFWDNSFLQTVINFHQQLFLLFFLLTIKENYFHKYLFNLFSFKCMLVFALGPSLSHRSPYKNVIHFSESFTWF